MRLIPTEQLGARPLIQLGKVEGFKKVEHECKFEKHKCRDEKVAHIKTHKLNYNTNIRLIDIG